MKLRRAKRLCKKTVRGNLALPKSIGTIVSGAAILCRRRRSGFERQITLLRRAEEPDRIRQRGEPKWIPSKPKRQPKRIVPQAESPCPRDGVTRGPRGESQLGRRAQRKSAPWILRIVIKLCEPIFASRSARNG